MSAAGFAHALARLSPRCRTGYSLRPTGSAERRSARRERGHPARAHRRSQPPAQPCPPRTAGAIPGVAAAGFFLLVLVGCAAGPPPPVALPLPEPEPPAAPEPEPPPDVEPLLEQARLALEAHRLTTPERNSAFSLYQEVLRLDPGNDRARRGIEKIVERYVRFALDAIDRRQFARARSMLARARLVDAGHPAIAPTAQQAQLVENAERDRVRLDPAVLANRSAALGARLRGLGVRAKGAGCRVTINARSDAEGRWIYRQLNSASGEARVRARMAIASPPSVELVCLGDTG